MIHLVPCDDDSDDTDADDNDDYLWVRWAVGWVGEGVVAYFGVPSVAGAGDHLGLYFKGVVARG